MIAAGAAPRWCDRSDALAGQADHGAVLVDEPRHPRRPGETRRIDQRLQAGRERTRQQPVVVVEETQQVDVTVGEIAKSVVIFLGIPLLAGFCTRLIGVAAKGADWYDRRFCPRIGPIALYGLLFTIVILFALQGETITGRPFDVARIALPLLAYFAVMWFGSFAVGFRLGLPYDRNASVAFTAAGNNFELAIAVAIGVFGVSSGQALAGVVGPLIEVPVLVGLVYVALAAKRRFYDRSPRSERPGMLPSDGPG